MTVWYRVADTYYCEDGYTIERDVFVRELPVISETDKTVLLDMKYGKTKRVLKDARRRFAYPTKELALSSYLRRKQVQVSRLEQELNHAKDCHAFAALLTGFTTA